MANIRSYRELRVYQMAFGASMRIFELSKSFPPEERYSLTDQIRRCSRSVCANIAEAWRRRRYSAHFVAKLNDSETEAEETRVWLEFSVACKYLNKDVGKELHENYDSIIGQLVTMTAHPEKWTIS